MSLSLMTHGRRSRRYPLLPATDGHQAEHFEQALRADLRGVGRRIVLRRDFDHVAADDVETGQAAQDAEHFARREPADFGRAGARGEARIDAVDVEAHVSGPSPTTSRALATTAGNAHRGHVLVVQHRHPAVVGKLPQVFGAAADADLDRAFRIEHAGQHRLPERSAVMKLGPFVHACRVAVRIDVDHADRPIAANRLEDRIGDRMVAAHRQRNDRSRRTPA